MTRPFVCRRLSFGFIPDVYRGLACSTLARRWRYIDIAHRERKPAPRHEILGGEDYSG